VSRVQRLIVVLVLNLALVAGLVAVGVGAHSLGVLAEGGDYLLDAAGAGLALLAIRLSARRAHRWRLSPTGAAALVNAGWLLLLELIVAGASIDRLATRTPQVHGLPVLVASGIAAVVMTAGALVLRGDDDGEQDLSVAAVLLDTIADAGAAAGVAAAGAIILVVRGWYWLDPAVALTIAVLVAYHAVALIRALLRD
jgi:cobalt-zinc-cadmium efflux system protein